MNLKGHIIALREDSSPKVYANECLRAVGAGMEYVLTVFVFLSFGETGDRTALTFSGINTREKRLKT